MVKGRPRFEDLRRVVYGINDRSTSEENLLVRLIDLCDGVDLLDTD